MPAGADGFDLGEGVRNLEKAAAAGEQVGQKVGAQPEADDRHIALIHQRAQLVDLLRREKLALIGDDDIHAGVLVEFFDDIIAGQDDIRLFFQPDAGFDDIGTVPGIHRRLDEPDGHAQLLVVKLGDERLRRFGAAHRPVFEVQLCHFCFLLRFGAGRRLPAPQGGASRRGGLRPPGRPPPTGGGRPPAGRYRRPAPLPTRGGEALAPIIPQAGKKRHPAGDSAFTKISVYSLTSSLTEAARPAIPWISLGMMILVA